MAMSSSASVSPAENDLVRGDSSNDNTSTKTKISYRSAKPTDVPAIAGLLESVFEDDEEGEEQWDTYNDATTNSKGNGSDTNANDNVNANANDKNSFMTSFMWDSLTDDISEPQLSPQQELELIEVQLAKRMVDAKKEDSLPHLFLVATIPSSVANDHPANNKQEEDRIIGFIEMGTLPPPISNSPLGKIELPYIGNVAVSNDVRRRKIGSTLVRLATKIATKWCAPSLDITSFPLFLFLSVERDNHEALKFYERLGFEELKVAKSITIRKIYLAFGLN
jgi:ribosomal protein S18 acetylase RimI-like enzyme